MRRLIPAAVVVAGMLGGMSLAGAPASARAISQNITHSAKPLYCPPSTVCLYDSSGHNTEGLDCVPHIWPRSQLVEPIAYLINNCRYRTWIHQNENGSGWAVCIGPFVGVGLGPAYQRPGNLQVTSNTSAC